MSKRPVKAQVAASETDQAEITAETLFKPEPEVIESEVIETVVLESDQPEETPGIGHNSNVLDDIVAGSQDTSATLDDMDNSIALLKQEAAKTRKDLASRIANAELDGFTRHMIHWFKHHDWTTLAKFMKTVKPSVRIRLALQHIVPNAGWANSEARFFSKVDGEKMRIDSFLLNELVLIRDLCKRDGSNPFICDDWKKYFPDNRAASKDKDEVLKSVEQSLKTQIKNAKKAGVDIPASEVMAMFNRLKKTV